MYQRWQWGNNPLLCHLQSPLQGIFIIISSLSISAIAIDRCIVICCTSINNWSARYRYDNNRFVNTSLTAPGALAHRLRNPKWPPGSGKVSTSRFLGTPVKRMIISFIVATNVIAIRPPKRRLTGTLTTYAKMTALTTHPSQNVFFS